MHEYSFEIHKDTYLVINRWLEHLKQYDDKYIRDSISNFKIRRAQQIALNLKNNQETFPVSNFEITKSENIFVTGSSTNDYHLLEIQAVMEQQQGMIINFEDGLETLSERINLYLDDEEDNNLIDFFK